MKKNKKKSKSGPVWGKGIVFYQSYEFYKRFYLINDEFISYSINDFKSFFKEFLYQIDLITYEIIYIEIDPIFCKLDEILNCIDESQSKKATISLITTDAVNYYQLKKRAFPKNIRRRLWMEKEIIGIE